MIRSELTLVSDPVSDLSEAVAAPSIRRSRTQANSPKVPELRAFPPPPAVPAWARATGRAGESEPLFFAGVSLAQCLLSETCLVLGAILTAPYSTPTTDEHAPASSGSPESPEDHLKQGPLQ